jgi:hypothetical protein
MNVAMFVMSWQVAAAGGATRDWRGEMNEERYGVMGTKVISAISISCDVGMGGGYAPLNETMVHSDELCRWWWCTLGWVHNIGGKWEVQAAKCTHQCYLYAVPAWPKKNSLKVPKNKCWKPSKIDWAVLKYSVRGTRSACNVCVQTFMKKLTEPQN